MTKEHVKEKIAISIDNDLLKSLDKKVDGKIIRSRSQAIEFFLTKGMEDNIDTAVIMIRGSNQNLLLKEIDGDILIKKHVELLKNNNVKNIFLLTQKNSETKEILEAADNELRILDRNASGNAEALSRIKDSISSQFIVISGDVFIDFNLKAMVDFHKNNNKIATIGLMTRAETSEYGEAVLEGTSVIGFHEKPQKSESHAVNSGIYIFNPEIFEYLKNSRSLEKDVFPKLANNKELAGFFTHGKYFHVKE